MNTQDPAPATRSRPAWLSWVAVFLWALLLICAVSLVGTGFRTIAGDEVQELFAFATNPMAGLVVATFATAVIQSSSTVVSVIVGMVAGGLPISMAIPMVMGADIGTSLTNTLVSLGHVRRSDEFRRAFAAATIQDFFNLLSVLIFLPVELLFHPLEKMAGALADEARGADASMESFNLLKAITSPAVKQVKELCLELGSPTLAGILMVLLGIGTIFLAIHFIGQLMQSLMTGRAKKMMDLAIGKGPISGIISGTIITVLVQSSSTTTSLAVPLAGSGTITLKQVYPFTLGANIGTCITGLLAATAVTGDSKAAIEIASFHVFFNVLGVILIYGIPFLRDIPLRCAAWMGELSVKNRWYALAYVFAIFFVAPGISLYISAKLL